MIDVTLLGTSALLPLPDRALTAALLTAGGRGVLFDCGEGTQTAARKAGVSLFSTDLIALTHYHGDHIFGLPGLLQTLFSMGRTAPLYLTGPKGLEAALEPILRLAGELSFEARLLPLPPEGLRLRDLGPGWPDRAVLTAFPTRHRVASQGYVFSLGRAGRFRPERASALGVPKPLWGRLQKGETVVFDGVTVEPEQVLGEARRGLKVVFTGDTAPCETLTEAARGADLMLSEATYAEDADEEKALSRGHMTFSLAAKTAAEAKVKRLWLTHFSQAVEQPDARLSTAAAVFPGAVCGYDGLSARLRFED